MPSTDLRALLSEHGTFAAHSGHVWCKCGADLWTSLAGYVGGPIQSRAVRCSRRTRHSTREGQ